MTLTKEIPSNLTIKRIFVTWWPLAASWVLMGAELPAVSAIMARMEYPKISLAAYGGIIFPLSLIIEAPIIMLLAASTALCKDWDSYTKIRRFMMVSGASLTALHILIAFTPIYYVVVEDIIGAPALIVEPARIGLMIMTPWTWAIAYRRFNQGILIRFGYSQAIGIGTVIRLVSDGLVLMTGYLIGTISGVIVATSAVAIGVISEAIYSGIVVRPVINQNLKGVKPLGEPLTFTAFMKFYIPLAMTSLITLLALPIGSAALSRMPRDIDSLAVWPVLSGLIFIFRSMGMAYNEVVVALLDEQNSSPNLRRFTGYLVAGTTTAFILVTITPFSIFWLGKVSALPTDLSALARSGLWIALPLPALTVLQSWYQGVIMYGRHTRGITEAVVIYLVINGLLLSVGVISGQFIGLYVGLAAMTISFLVQTAWLWYRSKPIRHEVCERDNNFASLQTSDA
jgi:hypothetical protein